MAHSTMSGRLNDTPSDKERVEKAPFECLKAELVQAYATPESAYKALHYGRLYQSKSSLEY